MRLGSKTSLTTFILILTISVILSATALYFQQEALQSAAFNGVDSMARTSALMISRMAADARKDAEAIAATIPPLTDRASVVNHLKKMYEVFGIDNGIFVLDAQGVFYADYPSHPDLHGHSFAFRDYYLRTVEEGRGVVGDPYISKRTGAMVVTVTAPVFDERQRLRAIVACSYDLLGTNALGTVRRQQFGRTGYLFMFDHDRKMILHPDTDRLLKRDIPPGANRLLDAALEGFQGAGRTVNSRGVEMLAAFRQVPGMPWIVAVQIPANEAFETLHTSGRVFFGIALVSFAFVLLVGLYTIRRITRPLNTLRQAAIAVSGELQGTARETDVNRLLAGARTNDEIGTVAAAFERLVEHQRANVGMLTQAAAEWEHTFDSVSEALFVLDTAGAVLRMNRAASDWFRISASSATGRPVKDILFGSSEPGFDLPVADELDAERAKVWTSGLPHREGVYEFSATPLQRKGTAAGMILIIRDFTDHARKEEDIRKMATSDALTGLPNRTLLTDRLHLALAASIRRQCGVAVLFLDLDHFKQVNDTYGHAVGDELLKAVAARLGSVLRRNDTVARLGGDEFVVVLAEISRPEDAAAVASKIVLSIQEPFSIAGHTLTIGTSIGIALSPRDGSDERMLLKHADAAMYSAKKEGRGTFCFYEA
ncbi:MAG: diguanylate cyclase, partial [Nitrospiraceae bacterium]|nr:diguanylate cyclase [Nitrospiraceae bacterium]